MSEQATATPKTTATNIVTAIHDKASGKSASNQDAKAASDKETVQAPIDPNAGKKKYVVDGKEKWLSNDEVDAYAQKGLAFEPKVTQLAHLQHEVNTFMNDLLDNPLPVLKKIAQQKNIPIEQIYEKVLDGDWPDSVKEIVGKKYYGNVVEPLRLTPEELKARENEKKLTDYERKEKQRQDEIIKNENQVRFQAALNQAKTYISEAMKESGLPDNDTPLGAEMARRVADVMVMAHKQQKSVTPKQAIEMVKKSMKEFQSYYYDQLEGDALVKELGEKNAEKVKNYFLKLVKNDKQPVMSNGKPSTKKGAMNMDEFHDYLDELKRNNK